jgi:phosphoribosylamine---glycine ligase
LKVLVIGTGGREHALVHTFWRQGHLVYCYPGNPGMLAVASPLGIPSEELHDYARLVRAVKDKQIDLTVVGSEAHLEKGIGDLFASQNVALFGPSRQAARMESSKAWAKEFMAKYQIPTARFIVSSTVQGAQQSARDLFLPGIGVVVKASGLAGGKGVVCCQTIEHADEAIGQILEEKIYGSTEVVIEEFISGPEISFQCICDGQRILPLLAAQDHKRLYDRDLGPNTGGMGAYAPLPFLNQSMQEEIRQTIVRPTLFGLQQEGIDYRGILYFGLMLTKAGPKVLEYNCRFGDPEAQAVLPLLETDLAGLMIASIRGDLGSAAIQWKPQASCCVVLAEQGYPAFPLSGNPIKTMQNRDDLFFFHAATAIGSQGSLVTAGGRVLGITALGNDLKDAIQKAYTAIDSMNCSWAHFRRDIGSAALFEAI